MCSNSIDSLLQRRLVERQFALEGMSWNLSHFCTVLCNTKLKELLLWLSICGQNMKWLFMKTTILLLTVGAGMVPWGWMGLLEPAVCHRRCINNTIYLLRPVAFHASTLPTSSVQMYGSLSSCAVILMSGTYFEV